MARPRYQITGTMDYRTNTAAEGAAPVGLAGFERSPRLAELKVAYRSRTRHAERPDIRDAKDAEAYLRAVWNRDTLELVEEFVVVCLNGAHQALGWVKVASGGLNATLVDPRVVGGIRVQVGDEVVDGTILRRLDEARRHLGA